MIATGWYRDRDRMRRAVEKADADADAAEKAAGMARTEALDALRASMAGAINATIVEIVAAQQAVVRAAHPDDILLRLTAAEDQAHTALTALPVPDRSAGQAG